MTVDVFLTLQEDPTVDASITATRRRIQAVRESAPVRQTSVFDVVAIETLDPVALNALLSRALPDLDAEAAGQVRSHIAGLGAQGERWIVSGVDRAALPAMHDHNLCPLCAQNLDGSPIFAHYRSYFSQAYTDLKTAIETALSLVETQVGDGTLVRLQEACRITEQLRDFWSRFTALPVRALPLDALMAAARTARDAMLTALRAKQVSPLDAALPPASLGIAIAAHNAAADALRTAIAALVACNPAIEEVKRGVLADCEQTLTDQLNHLLAVKARFTPEAVAACTTLMQERAAKTAAETRKEAARTALDQYRDRVFPQYTAAINRILTAFNAGFQIELQAENPGGRPSTSYHVLVNNGQVPLNLPAGRPPGPSFRTALSAGDRATLALAFFFASLESHPQLANTIIVIDDPVSSLDDYRAGTTATKIKSLLGLTLQVVVLCHSKAFLCQFWEDEQVRPHIAALKIERSNPGSELERWDIQSERLTEHDRRQELMQAFLDAAPAVDKRKVAEALRPHLEAYCRVAFPEVAKPGKLLGPIVNELRQRVGQPNAILDLVDCIELEELKDYGNRFHHDGSAAWTSPAVIDQELVGFVRRTLKFIRRSRLTR
jgi:wobble nucleotide-excising tRNase